MTSIYVDEDVGRDDSTANGSESAPYKTLAHAFLQHAPTDGTQYLMRKSQTEPTGENVDPTAKLEWKPAAKSAIKKATNLYEQRKKKAAKEQELAIREKEEADKRQQVLEEAKKLGVPSIWLQPGTFDDEVLKLALGQGAFQSVVYGNGGRGHDGWCVLVDGEKAMKDAGKL